MRLIYKIISFGVPVFFFSSLTVAATSEFKVAFGMSIASIAQRANAGYEAMTSTKVKAVQENGMSSDSVLILVSRGAAELGVSGNSWENILELVKNKKLEIGNLEKIQHSVIGTDHIKVITYNGGPKKLTKDQLKMIFTGQALNWRDIGGENIPIQIVLAARLPATEQTFSKAVLDGEDIYRRGCKSVQTMKEMSAFISDHKGSVGLTSGGNEMPDLNNPEQPAIEKIVTALTLGEPSERSKKLIDQFTKILAH